jgi:phosphatidylserine/phosphatidylglycerophosphate/cardiolipin synthase-like enzyme
VDDDRVLIGSANFTGAAFRRNLELGVVLSSEEAARRIRHYFDAILAMAGARLPDGT